MNPADKRGTAPDVEPDEETLSEGDAHAVTAENVERLLKRVRRLKTRLAELSEERLETRKIRERLKSELGALRSSYYFAGFGKKIDISQLPEFSAVANLVIDEGRIGMHFDRLYTIWQALMMAPRGVAVAEVGSYKGGSSKFIAESLRRTRRTSRFYVCDTFSGHARLNPAIDGVESDEGFKDTSAESVRAYLADYPNVELVVGDIVETSATLKEPAYGFVHIDVDVYPPTAFCLDFFSKRLAPGAWMVVDDYGVVTCPGAQRAVDDFVRDHAAFSKLHLLSGQAVIFRAG